MTENRRAGQDPRYGTVTTMPDGHTGVRFERQFPQSVAQVWAAITEPEALASWFPGLRFEPRQGGRFEIHFGGDCEGPAHVSGEVSAYDPPHVLQLGTIRWELSPLPDGGCRLVFTDVLVCEGGRGERDIALAVLGGWHRYLDLLEDAAAGRVVDLSIPEPDYSSRLADPKRCRDGD